MDATKATLPFLRVSTIGLMLLLFGNLLFALNIFGLTFVWEKALVKKAYAIVTAPLKNQEVKA
jgi:cbb3-type cytochrome oxidase subunit 1